MKLLSKDETGKETKADGSEQILQVRELLFGESYRQIDARLEALKAENDQLRKLLKETEDKLVHFNNTLANTIKNEREADNKRFNEQLSEQNRALLQKIKNLEDNKVDRGQIGQAFMEWGAKVQQIASK